MSEAIMRKISQLKKNLHYAYKTISFFEDCVYNVEFVDSPRRLILASDQKYKICLTELYQDYRIEILKIFSFHDQMI
jgi:hypothetical protein